ncbi:MAG: RNB domain-containing ribonuclease [Treponemataceae bacterium]|nr:RNB domain-containing ribonuclease [Treponemataceae bacterium]
MLKKNQAVIYKKSAAVVTEIEDEKFVIKYCVSSATPGGKPTKYENQKVREKDVVPLPGENVSLEKILSFGDDSAKEKILEAYELLISDEESAGKKIPFEELLDLIDGAASAEGSFFYFTKLCEGFEFALDEENFKTGKIFFAPRSQEEISLLKKKADEKENGAKYFSEFIARLKSRSLDLPNDSKFMGEVEAVALGKTEKSKVMAEMKIAPTPENAHRLLLETKIWDSMRNPHPVRWGLSTQSAQLSLASPPQEERLEIPEISYAIDSEHSHDPDDAVAFDGKYLWVHIADPASSVMPQSAIDKAAMNRGGTLYIPEGASRMLCEDCLEDYALGLKEKSNALSFRILLDDDGAIEECKIFKTLIKVKRLTYKNADLILAGNFSSLENETQSEREKISADLNALMKIAERNIERRKKNGSVDINMPEVHIWLSEEKKVFIEPEIREKSADLVREMMLLAGEGAARFAFANKIPFVYVSQEKPEIPSNIPEGLAGDFATIKCMRRRSVGLTPSSHAGLGLGMYSQVTSPLRRYGDLLCHEQLRAFLDGRDLIDKDAMLERMSAGDEASIACRKASRKSELHWTLVYLSQNPEWNGEAVCVDFKGKEAVFLIPELAQQTSFIPREKIALNETRRVKVKSIDIPNLRVNFVEV